MEATPHHEHGARRTRSIRLAVATSLLSKVGTAALQLLAIPIAIRVLGRAEFGIYTSVTLTLTTVSLFEVGVGPALAHGLAKASATADREKARVLASTSFFTMLGIALLVALVAGTMLAMLPVSKIYGADYAAQEGILRPALWTGLGLFLMLFLLNLTERIREGYLEVATTNACGAVGNVVAAIAVAVGVHFLPQVWFLVLAIHGSLVLTKLANTTLLWRKRPDMIPNWKSFRPGVARHLLGDGLAFSTCCLITGVVEYNVIGWMIGRGLGPSQVALYGVLVSLTVMQSGFILMLTTPTWPAVAEALARDDKPWAKRAARKLYTYGGAFALAGTIGMTTLGPWAFKVWLGKEFADLGHGLFACYSLYFLAHIWRHLNHTLMIGTGQITRMARVQIAESILVACVAWAGLHYGGIEVMLLSMSAVLLMMTGRILPGMVASVLGSPATPPADPEPRPA